MKHELIDRYVYAVTKRMDRKIREDVQNELYGLIDDMLTERCGEMAPTEKDVRVVLTELGSPQELYAKYSDDGDKCLIGQPYYSTYKFVLKIVLICAAVGLTIGSLVVQLLEPQPWYEAFGNYVGEMLSSGMAVFGGLTLLFAVFYRKGIKLDDGFNLSDLPPVPKKKQEISSVECILGIVFSVAFAVLFLVVPQVMCAVFKESGENIPIFSIAALRDSWYFILLISACGIISETVKLLERQYNKAVLVTTLVTNAISVVVTAVWLSCFDLMNPQFVTKLTRVLGEPGALDMLRPDNFQNICLVGLLIVLAIDTVEVVVKTIKNRK